MSARPSPSTVPVVARAYSHPLADDLTVVRLVREPLVEAADVTVSTVGLTPTGNVTTGPDEAPPAVATGEDRAVGFPDWPILNDPANAQHALAMVGDLKRIQRIAATKPTVAEAQAKKLAEKLDGTAPHFLPTFFEEVARAFLVAKNINFAGKFFSRARTVERTHAIPVDQERHAQVFLEFAMAEALPVKEITEESKQLLARLEPAEALENFLSLLIELARVGLSPYADTMKDLGRLINAAKVDKPSTEIRFIAALLETKAFDMAPSKFWSAAAEPLAAYLAEHPEQRAEFAVNRRVDAEPRVLLDIYDRSGFTDQLRAGAVDTSEWFKNFLTHVTKQSWGTEHDPYVVNRLLAFVDELPGLTGTRIELPTRVDALPLRVLDALLALGVEPSATRGSRPEFGKRTFTEWAADPDRVPLTRIAADPVLLRVAVEGLSKRGPYQVDDGYPSAELVRTLAHTPGGPEILAAQLLAHGLGERMQPSLSRAHHSAVRLRGLLTPELVPVLRAACPEAMARLEEYFEPAALTASTLRIGLLTELTWPAFEHAYRELTEKDASAGEPPKALDGAHESFPAVGLSVGSRVIFVDGNARVADVDVPTSGSGVFGGFICVGGKVLSAFWRHGSLGTVLRWSHVSTGEVIHGRHASISNGTDAMSIEVPGGRLAAGGLLRPGDFTLPERKDSGVVLSDGTGYWAGWGTELDPGTGLEGRESWPPVVAEAIAPHLREGFEVLHIQHRPVTETTKDSLFSTANGMHSMIVLRRHPNRKPDPDDHTAAAERIIHADGRIVEHTKYAQPHGVLARPGGGCWHLGLNKSGVADKRGTISLDGTPIARALTRWGVSHPVHLTGLYGLHQLRVRDAQVSARMREVTAGELTGLMRAAREWIRGIDTSTLPTPVNENPREPVNTPLPSELIAESAAVLGTDDPALTESVAWLAVQAAVIAPKGPNPPESESAGSDVAATRVNPRNTFAELKPGIPLGSLGVTRMRSARLATSVDRHEVFSLAARLDGEVPELRTVDNRVALLAAAPHALLAAASSPVITEQERRGAAGMWGALNDAGLATSGTTLFAYSAPEGVQRTRDVGPLGTVIDAGKSTGQRGRWARRWWRRLRSTTGERVRAIGMGFLARAAGRFWMLGLSPSGALPTVVNDQPVEELFSALELNAEDLTAAFTTLLADGPPAWDPARADRLHALTGIGRAAATILLAAPHLIGEEQPLTADHRKLLGLSTAEARAGFAQLALLPGFDVLGLLAAGARTATRVVREGVDPDRVAERHEVQRPGWFYLPEDVMDALSTTPFMLHKRELVTAILADELPEADSNGEFKAQDAVGLLLFLAAAAPYGTPARGWIGRRFGEVREWLASGTLVPRFGNSRRPVAPLGLPDRDPSGPEGTHHVGGWVVTRTVYRDVVRWHAAGVADWNVEAKLAEAMNAHLDGVPDINQVVLLLSGELDELIADLRQTAEDGTDAVGRSGPGQDPLVSAPALVAEVAAELGVGEESARYYLQLLTLAEPTDQNIDNWNGWKKKQRVAAAAPLLEQGLILDAKRARAGRSYFVPGGWTPAKPPHLPIEQWKLPLYRTSNRSTVTPFMQVMVPLESFDSLFRRAWQRTRDGDAPEYDEL